MPAPALYLHPVQEQIQGVLGGRTVVDTIGAVLLHETGLLPRWYLPEGTSFRASCGRATRA